jgi:hypothetical protein
MHNFDVAHASQTGNALHHDACSPLTSSRWEGAYARARTLIWNPPMIHTTHMPRWIHLLVKCLSLSVETKNLCGLTNGHVADNRTRESVREDHHCMHVARTLCMKGMCNALNKQFTTLMWHIWLTKWSIIPHGGSRLVVYCRTPPPHNPHTHRHTHPAPPQLLSGMSNFFCSEHVTKGGVSC